MATEIERPTGGGLALVALVVIGVGLIWLADIIFLLWRIVSFFIPFI